MLDLLLLFRSNKYVMLADIRKAFLMIQIGSIEDRNYRVEKGHFNLRSWNTNCEELKTLMIKEQKFVEHGCQLEKVLGYKYSTQEDTLQISGSPIDQSVNSKRGILAQTARVFDPLSLCLPVTIRGKMLLRDLWSQKLDWDDIVSKEFQNLWSALSCDLAKLDSLQFCRDRPANVNISDYTFLPREITSGRGRK